jgi:signal transduction histidine kinase
VIAIWALFLASRVMAAIERSRLAALLGEPIADPVPPLASRTPWGRFGERLRSRVRWKEIAYHVLALPRGVFTTVTAVMAWGGSLAMVLLPLYVSGLPGDTAKFGLFEVSQGPTAVGIGLAGLAALVFVAPWVSRALARLDVATGRWLLAPRDTSLGEQVSKLETSRAAAVDSAEAERRRIERDLHDGAQQRLVALAMGLGAARERIEADPEAGRQLVAEAHEEAKAALKEIRDLVRGIHPVILEDRGLDAALSAVVARTPVPVALDVDVRERPPAVVESTAYFVVTEALTNIARHASATRASVSIVRAGDRLVVEVRDDGVGGADPAQGSGLQGLRDRVTALGGNLHLVSPPGGPTTLLVDLPCAS